MLCAGGVAVLALAEAGEVALVVGVRLAALALLGLLAAIVLGWNALVPVSLVLLGAAYATHLYDDELALDLRAPLVAAGLFLAAELGYWSLEERWRMRADAGEGLRRLGLVTLVALAGMAAAAVLLAGADLARTGGLAVDLLGAVAAAAALLVLVLFARQRSAS